MTLTWLISRTYFWQCFNARIVLYIKKELTLLNGLWVRTRKHRKDMGFFSTEASFTRGSVCLSAVPFITIHAVRIQLEAIRQMNNSPSPDARWIHCGQRPVTLKREYSDKHLYAAYLRNALATAFLTLAYSGRHVFMCDLVWSLPPPRGRFIQWGAKSVCGSRLTTGWYQWGKETHRSSLGSNVFNYFISGIFFNISSITYVLLTAGLFFFFFTFTSLTHSLHVCYCIVFISLPH